ncbi:hypothetical protein ACPV4S_05840 [Vibrio alginolyticus]|uniref:hypothetical protein n=1 Tax=Vibrio alginolyticus TaxID=663 RepID=UPI004067E956
MNGFTRQDKALIKHVRTHSRKTEQEAIAYLDRHCGDWRGTPLPKAKRIKSLGTGEVE